MKTRASRVVAFSTALALLGAAPASAETITQAFCSASTNPVGESATCPEGLGAVLRITDEGAGLDPTDPNDFYVLLAVSTLALDGFDTTTYTGIDGVQFDTAFKTTDYEVFPTLSTAGVDGSAWTAFFGNVADCSLGTFKPEDKSVCSTGLTDTGDIDIWAFQINLLDSLVNPFTAASDLNLRVSFFPTHNLSPNS